MRFIASALLRSKIVWAVLAVGAVWSYGYYLGNQHGSYARAYRSVVKELATKNKELKALRSDDEVEVSAESAALDNAHAKAVKALGSGPKATKAQADLLNSIGE